MREDQEFAAPFSDEFEPRRNTMKTGEKRQTSGLSLAEAHASGRKYRRVSEKIYFRFNHEVPGGPTLADALATDYELEPQAKLLTRDEVGFTLTTTMKFSPKIITEVLDELFGPEDDK